MIQPDEARAREIAEGLHRQLAEEAPNVAKRLAPALKRALMVAVNEGTIFAYDGRREVRSKLMDMWLVSYLPGPTWGKPTPLGRLVAAEIARMEARDAPEAP